MVLGFFCPSCPSLLGSHTLTVDFWKERLWGGPDMVTWALNSLPVIAEEVRESKQEAFKNERHSWLYEGVGYLSGNVSGPLLITSKEMETNHQGPNSTNNQSEFAEPPDRNSSWPVSRDTLSRGPGHTVLESCSRNLWGNILWCVKLLISLW